MMRLMLFPTEKSDEAAVTNQQLNFLN